MAIVLSYKVGAITDTWKQGLIQARPETLLYSMNGQFIDATKPYVYMKRLSLGLSGCNKKYID